MLLLSAQPLLEHAAAVLLQAELQKRAAIHHWQPQHLRFSNTVVQGDAQQALHMDRGARISTLNFESGSLSMSGASTMCMHATNKQ